MKNWPPRDLSANRPFAFRREPMFHRAFRSDLPAIRAALGEIRLRFYGYTPDDTIDRLELVLAEVLNNICEHGSVTLAVAPDQGLSQRRGNGATPTVHLSVIRHDSGIVCTITDDGIPLPATCLTDGPRTIATELPEGGFGWRMIRDLTNSISYTREGRRNFVGFTVPYGYQAAQVAYDRCS